MSTELDKLPKSFQYIIHELSERKRFTPAEIRQVILNGRVAEEDVLLWRDEQHSPEDSYGRQIIYAKGHFELMSVTWCPGDFSAIHDHGDTSWGAVLCFGDLEHATYRLDGQILRTNARNIQRKNTIALVGNDLIHQMGNHGNETVQSFHVYGNPDSKDGDITGGSRIYNLADGRFQVSALGSFYANPPERILEETHGLRGDLCAVIRDEVEKLRRMEQMGAEEEVKNAILQKCFELLRGEQIIAEGRSMVDEKHQFRDKQRWDNLHMELKVLARQEAEEGMDDDSFGSYAAYYDQVVCQPCLNNFMKAYIQFFQEQTKALQPNARLISLGCGTGMVEEYIKQTYSVQDIRGVDLSESMVEVASTRIDASVADLSLELKWEEKGDVAFSGLNVFQYLSGDDFEVAIRNARSCLKEDGFFFGDFVTPDHIRAYPNFFAAEEQGFYSFRTPEIVERDGFYYQESDLINLMMGEDRFWISHEGKHRRYLPTIDEVRSLFASYFTSLALYDAHSLKQVAEGDTTTESTRYIVIAKA